MSEKSGKGRVFPILLEMRNKAWYEDEIERSLTYNLIGDGDVSALGISRIRMHRYPGHFQAKKKNMMMPKRTQGTDFSTGTHAPKWAMSA
jgi:hypothetical protein